MLILLDSGGVGPKVGHVYTQRASILMDALFKTDENHEKNNRLFYSESPKQLRIINAYDNLLSVWKYIMNDEFTYCRIETCQNGHTMGKVFASILLNEDIVKTKGY